MWKDPIVEDIRQLRDTYAARFDYDLEAIARDLVEQQERLQQEGWTVVSLPPRHPDQPEQVA